MKRGRFPLESSVHAHAAQSEGRKTSAALRLFAGMMTACLSLTGCGDGDEGPSSRFSQLERAIEAERVQLGAPGVAVAIVENGEVTFAKGFGSKDARTSRPVEATTLFRIGSTTKPLTAVAVLRAVQSGLIGLEEPVTRYVPGFHLTRTPEAPAAIKVRHLLTHSSGLADFGDVTDAPPEEKNDAALEGYLTGRFADLEYAGAPAGAVWAYANANFMLAGLIAEKANNTPYRQLMLDQVFSPLAMTRTYFSPADVIRDGDYAIGSNCIEEGNPRCFSRRVGEVIEPDTYDNPWARPAGHAWSSVLDMARFARFLLHGAPEVLSDELRIAMSSAHVSTRQAGDEVAWGYGLLVATGFRSLRGFEAVELLDHGGDIAGFSSTFRCLPALDFCFIALSNANVAHFDLSFVTAFETLTDHPPVAAMPDVSPQQNRYPAYAGTYDELSLGSINVVAQAGNLSIEIPSLEADGTPYETQLKPTAVDNFLAAVDGTDRLATFFSDQNGIYRYIVARPYIAQRRGSSP